MHFQIILCSHIPIISGIESGFMTLFFESECLVYLTGLQAPYFGSNALINTLDQIKFKFCNKSKFN